MRRMRMSGRLLLASQPLRHGPRGVGSLWMRGGSGGSGGRGRGGIAGDPGSGGVSRIGRVGMVGVMRVLTLAAVLGGGLGRTYQKVEEDGEQQEADAAHSPKRPKPGDGWKRAEDVEESR